MDCGKKRSWGWSPDIGWAGERSISKLAFVTAAAAANEPVFFISLVIMATNGNNSAPGMGDIIQLNVGGTR